MRLKNLLSNLAQTFELLLTMSPTVDQRLLVLLAGIILGYLEMAGYASPADHAQNLDSLVQFLGAAITIITIISYFVHNAVVEKNKLKYGSTVVPPVPPGVPQKSFIQKLLDFALAQPTNVPNNIPGPTVVNTPAPTAALDPTQPLPGAPE